MNPKPIPKSAKRPAELAGISDYDDQNNAIRKTKRRV
jgi:hypothetical protein